jgi:hypothetical protein
MKHGGELAKIQHTSTHFNHLQPKVQPKKGILSVPYNPLKLLEKGTLTFSTFRILKTTFMYNKSAA